MLPTASDEASPAGAAAAAKHFPPGRRDIAPSIEIERMTSVKFGMEKVGLPTSEAATIAAQLSSPESLVEKAFPSGSRRYVAPDIVIDGEGDEKSVSVAMSFVDEPSTDGVAPTTAEE